MKGMNLGTMNLRRSKHILDDDYVGVPGKGIPCQKPATSLSEISLIEEGLKEMWKDNKKLYKFAATKLKKRSHRAGYLLDEKELI